jgi:hypothetical protein
VEEASVFLPNQAWPTILGGCEVQLFIGIKNTHLIPKVRFVMPNGLAIYESTFTDVSGSRLGFGGPHALFTEVYRSRGGSYNSLEAILAESVNAYWKSPWTFICESANKPSLELTALIFELQTSPPKTSKSTDGSNNTADPRPQLDSPDSVPCTEPLLEVPPNEVMPTIVVCAIDTDQTPCNHPHNQEVPKEVKSIIPLAKLKGLIDEIDIPEVQGSRCETCANCPTCKMSAQEKVQTLQEEFEQDVIKRSIETDTAQKKVFANFPFLRFK